MAFIGTAVAAALGRKEIASVIRGSGIRWAHVLAALLVVAIFIGAEIAIVKPTQLLFFDDVIYQGGAVDLLHMGQAWMCDYGTPTTCFTGEIFHEPIGASFLLAIGFVIFGVHLAVTYNTMLAITAVAVFMAFLVGSVLLRDPKAGIFSALLLGLAPIVLVWARPSTSDMPMLAFGLVAVFFMLVFVRKKSMRTLAAMLLSLSLVTYMKVDALLFLPIILIMFLILDSRDLRGGIKLLKKNIMEPWFLIIILLFAVSILPEAVYTYTQFRTGDYGVAQSQYLSFYCVISGPGITTSNNFGLANVEANFCPDVLFWFNAYKNTYEMQPLIYTLMAVLGVVALAFRKRLELLSLAVWFGAFFLVYLAFYAGSVLFGVDWRFMLAPIAPVSILGGYFASLSFTKGIRLGRGLLSKAAKSNLARAAAYAAIVVLIFYPIYAMEPLLAVKPSNVLQAPDARFYEGFVYSNIAAVPTGCLVFSYDPTFMNILNHTGAQIGYLNSQSYQSYKAQYGCLAIDWGYWCYTPDNYCTTVNQTFTLQSIVNATYTPENKTYGFYYVTGLKNASS